MGFKLGKMPQKSMGCFTLLLDLLAWIEPQFLSGIRDSRKAENLWGTMRGVGGVKKRIHQSWLFIGLGLGVGLLCCCFKKFRKRFSRKMPALFISGQCHFLQNNAPVHNSILVTDYLTKVGIKTIPQPPYSPDLAPCDFGYCLSSEVVVMRQLRRWNRQWRRSLTRSHKRTCMDIFFSYARWLKQNRLISLWLSLCNSQLFFMVTSWNNKQDICGFGLLFPLKKV